MAMDKTPPLISVVVRSMDPPTLRRALDSVAVQDFPGVEVVLVAACGPAHRPIDASQYPFSLRFVASERPLPRPRAANVGLGASRGDCITFLDHDDEFLPGHLQGLASELVKRPDIGASYCRFQVCEASRPVLTVGHPWNRLALHEKSYIHHSALLFRRELLATGVQYDEALDIHDDWDFVLQLSEKTRFAFVDQTTFRWHADIGTSGGGGIGNFDSSKYLAQRGYVLDKWAAVSRGHVDRYNLAVERGFAALQTGAFDEASRFLGEAYADVENDPDLLNALAMIASHRGDHRAAVELVSRAVRERSSDPRLWFNAGVANAAAGDVDAARRAFERTRTLQPDHRGALQWLDRLSGRGVGS